MNNYNKHLNTNIAILTGNTINTTGRLTNNLTPFTTTVEPSCMSVGTGTGGQDASHGIPNLVNTFDWNSDFTFNVINDTRLLMSDILPYYIENEMYEKCSDIRNLYISLEARNSKFKKNCNKDK